MGNTDGCMRAGPRKAVKKPASSSIDSHPNAKNFCPTFTMER